MRDTQTQGGGQGEVSCSGATHTGMTLQRGLRLTFPLALWQRSPRSAISRTDTAPEEASIHQTQNIFFLNLRSFASHAAQRKAACLMH